jgi:hypothetical protein
MAVPAADLTRLNRNLIRKEGKMIDSAMIERLRAQVSSTVLRDPLSFYPPDWRPVLAQFYLTLPELMTRIQTSLRRGEKATFKLPHSIGLLDHFKIGGAFFSASEDPIQDAVNIMADMIAVPRPVCWNGIFELDIQSPEHVEWRVCLHDGESEIEIQKGTDPLDQAFAKMASLGHKAWRLENIEESQLNMLSLVGTLEKKLKGWEVNLLRSCCLILRKRRSWWDSLFYSIHLCLVPGRGVVACTASHNGDRIIEECLSAATYQEHALPFILEVAKRIKQLAVSLSEAPSEPVATQWGRVPVVIAPPDRVLEVFLPDMYRLSEI